MKKQVISAALAAALTAGICAPAQAVCAVQTAGGAGGTAALLFAAHTVREAVGAPSAPPAQTVRSMGMTGLERTVRAGNPTIKTLEKMVASLNSMSMPSQNAGQLEGAVQGYEMMIASLESACAAIQANKPQDYPNDPLYIAYQAQIVQLRANVGSLQGTISSLPIIEQMTRDAYEDAAYTLKKQTANVADQLCAGAEKMMIGMESLDHIKTGLERQLAALDRNLAVMKVQLDRGMVAPLVYENAVTGRSRLAASIDTLTLQREGMAGSLALMCGFGADTVIEPSGLPEVTARDFGSMKYETDLASAMKLSFARWEKVDAVRAAANKKDKAVDGTEEAYEAARADLAATEERLTAAFRQSYDAVTDARTKLSAAEFAVRKADADLEVSRVKYEIGALSQLAYQQAQDDAAAARDAVKTAEIDLLSAYRSYDWARRGLIPIG